MEISLLASVTQFIGGADEIRAITQLIDQPSSPLLNLVRSRAQAEHGWVLLDKLADETSSMFTVEGKKSDWREH